MIQYLSVISILLLAIYPDQWTEFSICPFFNMTSIPCPSCGMGRGLLSIYHLQFIQALKYHPVSYIIAYYQIKIGVIPFFRKAAYYSNGFYFAGSIHYFFLLLFLYWICRMIAWHYFPDFSENIFIDIRHSRHILN